MLRKAFIKKTPEQIEADNKELYAKTVAYVKKLVKEEQDKDYAETNKNPKVKAERNWKQLLKNMLKK